MKKHHVFTGAAISFALLVLAGCQKSVEENRGEHAYQRVHTSAYLENVTCRINTLFAGSQAIDYTYSFTYNSHGNPDSIIPNEITTGNPLRIFRYDSLQRLTDYIGPYNNGYFEFWHRYYYDSAGYIVRDTTYIFGEMGQNPTNYFYKRLNQYQYDVQSRISQVTETWVGVPLPPVVYTYSYDSNGNLVNGAVYDSAMNTHRTHPVWQFVARDYSMNNPFTAVSYVHKLPEEVLTGGAQYRFLDIWYDYKGEYDWLCY